MERQLSLVETNYEKIEKRVFPRFPFTYLIFKAGDQQKVYEVKDISFTGMQLSLKDGEHNYKPGDAIEGLLHWRTATLRAKGTIKWAQEKRFGLAFEQTEEFKRSVRQFLSVENIVAGMRPLHQSTMDIGMPVNLKYWVRADGPVEIFVWQHKDGELSRFQIILLKKFVEWEDGKGTKTGEVISSRDMDTPLTAEDEFVFKIDKDIDEGCTRFALDVISRLPANFLPQDAVDFIQMKLGK